MGKDRDGDSERERRKREPQIPKNNLVKICLKAKSNDSFGVWEISSTFLENGSVMSYSYTTTNLYSMI